MNTPLYNPKDFTDESKINTLVRKSFLNEESGISDDVAEFVSTARIIDMVDFTRTSFKMEFKTSVALKVVVDSKYEIIPLKKFCQEINPSKDEFSSVPDDTAVSFVEMASFVPLLRD